MTPHLCLLLPHLRLGGVEKGLCALIAPLQDRGWRVTVVAQSRDGALLDELDPAQACLDLGGRRFAGAAWCLAGLLRRYDFDLIYSATNVTNLIALLALRLAGRRGRAVCVISEHTPLRPFLATAKWPWLRRAAMRALYPRAAAFCTPMAEIGEEHRSQLPDLNIPFQVLPNAVVRKISEWRPVAPLADRLVAIGRLSREKRFDLAIEAFARLHAGRPEARLAIHGEGPERGALAELCARLGLTGVVTLPGETQDVAGVLAQADGFLCTSEREGLGNAIIEAQAAGVPVLSVDCPFGPRHLLRGGTAGCLVEQDDAISLGEAMKKFHGDAVARLAWREAAREVAETYTVDHAAQCHDKVFRQVLVAQQDRRHP